MERLEINKIIKYGKVEVIGFNNEVVSSKEFEILKTKYGCQALSGSMPTRKNEHIIDMINSTLTHGQKKVELSQLLEYLNFDNYDKINNTKNYMFNVIIYDKITYEKKKELYYKNILLEADHYELIKKTLEDVKQGKGKII